MDIVCIKENLKNYYNQESELRNKSERAAWKIEIRKNFCNLLNQEQKKTLLEIGAGAGYDSQFFMDNGLQVMAIDLSGEMVQKCKEKAIEAYELDFYNLTSLNKKFDGIWAMNTLLHVPKADLCNVLREINLALNDNGLFYMGVYGGEDFEGEYIKSEVSDIPRFFSFHSQQRIKLVLENNFEIISFAQFDVGNGIEEDLFQSVILRKKRSAASQSPNNLLHG